MKIVIIGAVASGAACAARLRRLDETAQIVLIERGEYVSYANCGLPYRVGDVITSKEALLVMTPNGMKTRFNAEVRTLCEAVAIEPNCKTVRVRHVKSGEVYDESYDKLVVATGSSPLRPSIPGIDSERIHSLWSVPDAEHVRELVHSASDVAVIGGGFVGLETVENLVLSGKRVTLIEAASQVMTSLDAEMAELIHAHLREKGVRLILADGVRSFEDDGSSLSIHLNRGLTIDVQQAVLAIGVRPNSEILKNAGIACNERGFVIVNERMETSNPDIYAAGDIVQIQDAVLNEPTNVPLAGPAAKQGRVVADRLGGMEARYRGAQGTSILKVFELSAASTGANEKKLIARGLKKHVDYETILIRANSHAAFYPGASPMTMKLLFACDGSRIYGAQIVGRDGVDKRIDVISTVIQLGGSVHSLETLDLAYAPPFGSAKDPVNMLGFVAQNVVHGLVRFCEVQGEFEPDVTLLDVREDAERRAFSIPNAIGIPLGTLRNRLAELAPGRPVIVFCAVGVRAYNAARILMQNGFNDVRVYPGGVSLYKVFHRAG